MHFVRGRAFEPAVRHLQLAAEQAFQRSAHPEAVGHLSTALEALRRLPDHDGRARWELTLQTSLGEILTAIDGWVKRRRRARLPASTRTMPADGGRADGAFARTLRPRQFVRVPR
jgi:hypothetical protein